MFEWRESIITQIDIPDVYQADRPLPSPLESQVLVIINTTTMILDVGLHVMDKIVPKCPGKPGNRSPVVSVDRGHRGMMPSPSWDTPAMLDKVKFMIGTSLNIQALIRSIFAPSSVQQSGPGRHIVPIHVSFNP